ncbi:putative mucin/carbohydrate-binding domain-containing protein [Bacillus cereus group sp. BfR-BA-01349]|uniref:putative mucin/carbohydrate-binding domain-containing protein n=1 Tax=Bacillus cereus group sp. BfR-BA-01349 TaxID=2920312 RepID=UPI001F572F9E
MRKKIITGLALLILFIIGDIDAQADEKIKEQEIFSIEEPTWIFKTGTSKGKYHDRQDLGFILRENTPLKVRQTQPNFDNKLTLRLLSNDSKDEKSVQVGSEWVTVQSDKTLVPFIDTPYGLVGATVEYQIESNEVQKPLPKYQKLEDVTQFFDTWDQHDAEYALIKIDSFQLFMPEKDKRLVKNSKDFQSLDDLIDYYETLFTDYNQMIGLDNSSEVNKISENRYFLKADVHGAGGAYYGDKWTANSASTTEMWLKKVSWGTLHEIGHGYQASFDNQGMYTGEVSNNLFAVQYQYDKYGKEADKIGWLFNYGKKEAVEKNLYSKLVKNNGTYSSIDLRDKLILLTMLKQKAGDTAFTKMYQNYRELANKPDFNKNKYSLPNLMNQYYSEHSGYDFTAVLQRWGISLDPIYAESNRAKGYPAVASLVDVVPEEQLSHARALVDDNILINSNFEMVTNEEIAPLNLKGDLTIQLKTKNIDLFKGEKVQLKEGNQVVKELVIEGENINFKDIPNGIYTLKIPDGKKGKYKTNQHYAYVKEKENSLTVDVEKIGFSNLTNQTIQFLGLGDSKFAEFQIDYNHAEAIFTMTSASPHNYYGNEKYASVEILTNSGQVVYSKEVKGKNNQTGKDIIPLKKDYQINIYHAESKNRLKNTEGIIKASDKLNSFTITKWGLKNMALQNNPIDMLMKKIDSKAMEILNDSNLLSTPLEDSEIKKHIWVAINSLPTAQRVEYFKKYKQIF